MGYEVSGFDSGQVRTYHTRPMSSDWSRAQDVDRLADAKADYPFDVDLQDFPRLRPSLAAGTTGRAIGRVTVLRELGLPTAEVAVEAAPLLTCQRCMRPVRVPISAKSRVVLVTSLDRADAVAAGVEPILVEDGRIAMRELVEEELLLGLPLVPMHAVDDADCVVLNRQYVVETGAQDLRDEEKQKPFAGLDKLLGR